jgi:hypothetical protein
VATQIIVVPVGSPQRVFLNQPGGVGSACSQPGATGSMLLEYSLDGVNFIAAPQGLSAAPYALGAFTAGGTPNPGGAGPAFPPYAVVRATAATVAGVLLVSDVSQVTGGVQMDRQMAAVAGVAYTMPNITTEANLFALRLPPGLLKANFRIEIDIALTLTNNANVKTLRAYFGNTGAGTVFETQAVTSFAGFRAGYVISGRNDGASVIGGNVGSAGGYGGSVTANALIVANAAYQTAEQELYITGQKATGTDALTLDQLSVRLIQ